LFGLSLYNVIQQHTNNKDGNFFFNSDQFITKDPLTVEQLKRQLENKNTKYKSMLRHFARNIRGSDNFWRSNPEDLKHLITHHIARGNGPPKFFITLSCTENWWPDLKHPFGQLDEHTKNYPRSEAIRNGCKKSMANAARRHPLYVNDFFMKREKSFMVTVVKKALGIDHYWGRVEFVPGRGAIHLHMICIARDKAYLWAFYQARTFEEKAEVLDKYA
jgi:hypothetical protein